MNGWRMMLLATFCVFISPASAQTWLVRQRGTILEIACGSGSYFPQYAALHLDSGYFRMVYSPRSGWGTSVILMPAFWSGGRYYQGAPVTVSWRHVSATQWDTRAAYVEGHLYNLPSSGWVIYPATTGRRFGLIGGTSSWKTSAPDGCGAQAACSIAGYRLGNLQHHPER